MQHSLLGYAVGLGTIVFLVGLIVLYHMIFDRPKPVRPTGTEPGADRPKLA